MYPFLEIFLTNGAYIIKVHLILYSKHSTTIIYQNGTSMIFFICGSHQQSTIGFLLLASSVTLFLWMEDLVDKSA